ncbi:hypothetical protein BDN70DRAFT_424505 [Pholiota conissans]|uniref:Uncharacterized protein n=1 Tax=Pholiota conissans TaxID=109636 RepID=A0A9P5YS28_9AGAR|nr:hypothetical protein BDN70DRAFT_424505 [Pholiota conissans]
MEREKGRHEQRSRLRTQRDRYVLERMSRRRSGQPKECRAKRNRELRRIMVDDGVSVFSTK